MPDDATIIDINDPLLQQEMVESDPEADFFEQPPPPPDDRPYQVRLVLGRKGLTAKRQKRKGDENGNPTGPIFLNANIEAHFIDPDQYWDGFRVDDYGTSIVFARSGTSWMHGILKACGAPAPASLSLADLREHFLGVLASEPTCFVEGSWEARYQQVPDDNSSWITVARGMKRFPLIDPAHPEQGHSPLVDVVDPRTKQPTGEQARAQFRISRYFAG